MSKPATTPSKPIVRQLSVVVGIAGCFLLFAFSSHDYSFDSSGPLFRSLAEADEVSEEKGSAEEQQASRERRLASPPPPSSDQVPNEYIVGIKPYAFAYAPPMTSGICSRSVDVTGTFYGLDSVNRCYKINIAAGDNRLGQTFQTYNDGTCGGITGPSSFDYDLGGYSYRFSDGSYYYSNGDMCGDTPRRTRVYVRYDSSLTTYTATVTEPLGDCYYAINLYLPYCTSSYDYQTDTYQGSVQATNLLNTYGGSLLQAYEKALHGFVATLTSAQASTIGKDQSVAWVEPNYVVRARGGGSALRNAAAEDEEDDVEQRRLAIPQFNLKEPAAHWGLERLSSRGAKSGVYLYFHLAEDTDIYFLDTGINTAHQQFDGRIGTSHKCHGTENDWMSTSHGTHVASLAAGASYGTGRKSTIHSVQVLDAAGEGTTNSVLCGVEWLIDQQLQYNYANEPLRKKTIASVTFGAQGRIDALDEAIGNLASEGGIVAVVAAGNDGDDACKYSPYHDSAITIGSIDDSVSPVNARSAFSNYGSCIDFFAPGAGIMGASHTGTSATYTGQGTSVAAGVAAGVAALYLDEVFPENEKYADSLGLVPAEVKAKIARRAYRNGVTNAGAGSPNLVVQGTASVCKVDAHCPPGLTCRIEAGGQCKEIGT